MLLCGRKMLWNKGLPAVPHDEKADDPAFKSGMKKPVRAQSGRLHVHYCCERSGNRSRPWQVKVGVSGSSVQLGRFSRPDDAGSAAAVAHELRQQLAKERPSAFRGTVRRVSADRSSGQMQLPLGDGLEFGAPGASPAPQSSLPVAKPAKKPPPRGL